MKPVPQRSAIISGSSRRNVMPLIELVSNLSSSLSPSSLTSKLLDFQPTAYLSPDSSFSPLPVTPYDLRKARTPSINLKHSATPHLSANFLNPCSCAFNSRSIMPPRAPCDLLASRSRPLIQTYSTSDSGFAVRRSTSNLSQSSTPLDIPSGSTRASDASRAELVASPQLPIFTVS